MDEADRGTAADRRVRARPRVRDRSHAGGDGPPVDDEAAVPVLDLGHDLDVGDRIAVEPVREQRIAGDDPLPHLDVLDGPQGRVVRRGDDPHPPGAVVSRQRQHRDRVVVLQQRPERGRLRTVVRTEVAAVVHEARVLHLLLGRHGTDRLQQRGERRTPTSGIDHEVSADLVSGVRDHAHHVGHTLEEGFAGQQPLHRHAPTDGQVRRGCGGAGEGGLDHGSPSRQRLEALVAVAETSRHRLGSQRDRVVAKHAVRVERLDGFRQLGFGYLTKARQEEVDHAELVDALPFPGVPRLVARGRRRRWVALQHRHLVAIAGQQHGGRQTAHATAQYKDAGHGPVPPFRSQERQADATPTLPHHCPRQAFDGVARWPGGCQPHRSVGSARFHFRAATLTFRAWKSPPRPFAPASVVVPAG